MVNNGFNRRSAVAYSLPCLLPIPLAQTYSLPSLPIPLAQTIVFLVFLYL
jgi:hypothetical protein